MTELFVEVLVRMGRKMPPPYFFSRVKPEDNGEELIEVPSGEGVFFNRQCFVRVTVLNRLIVVARLLRHQQCRLYLYRGWGLDVGHNSGGAIDIGLCDTRGQPFDMGSSYDDWTNPLSKMAAARLDMSARSYRRLLQKSLEDQDFRNNPDFWWKFHYGDVGWAAHNATQTCIYGPTQVHAISA